MSDKKTNLSSLFSNIAIYRFILIFISLAAFLACISFMTYRNKVQTEQAISKVTEVATIDLQEEIIKDELRRVASDLNVLTSKHEIQEFFKNSDGLFLDALAMEILSFSENKGCYDKIMFLNDAGNELIRIDYNNGRPIIVPEHQLQLKADTADFIRTYKLDKENIYISPFQLNVKNGTIEQPLKPVIIFGKPVFDIQGKKRGAIIFSYLGEKIIQNLIEVSMGARGQCLLLDANGYWIKGFNPEDEWGFMFPERKDKTFGRDFPDLWEKISGNSSGQILTKNGLFTYTTVHPYNEIRKTKKSSSEVGGRTRIPARDEKTYYWKIVSCALPDIVNAESHQFFRKMIILDSFILLFFVAGSWFLATTGGKQKIAEQALKGSEHKYRTLIENSVLGLIIVQEYQIVFANSQIADISGYAVDELIAMTPEQVQTIIHPDDRENVWIQLMEQAGENLIQKNYEFRIQHKGGATRWINVIGSSIDYMGSPAIQATFLDITDRKHAQEELDRHKQDLEVLVKERTNELEKANRKLHEAKETAETTTHAKSEFLANMSHEIRTPINAIIGIGDLIRNTDLSIKQKEYVDIMRSSSRSLLSLINDILDFSKIEAGKLDFEEIPFSLRDMMDEISDMFRDKIFEKQIEFIVDIAPDVPRMVISDPLRLRQILINLTSNALKFTDKGEIRISVENRATVNETADLLFSVVDTGIGINPAEFGQDGLDSLFDAFAQADSSTTRKYGGTGLGLAICKKIVDMMEGSIQVESKAGKGSAFYVSATFKFIPGSDLDKPRLPSDLKNLNVLVVEDNPVTLRVIKRFVESFGFRCVAADSAESAIEIYEKSIQDDPFDLILADVMLPGMDGIEAVDTINKNSRGPMPPVIFISSADYAEKIRHPGKADSRRFLLKPIKQSVLFDTIMDTFGYQPAAFQESFTGYSTLDKFSDTHVLLVEDNPVNQMVATEILFTADITVDKACNGKEAIDILKEKTYDAVLMDVQMPEIDGIEATRIIRAMEQTVNRSADDNTRKLKRIPIIAMTANAMTGDREKCLAAGMDDYMAKPIDSKKLFSVLSRWIKPSKKDPFSQSPEKIKDAHIKDDQTKNGETTKAMDGGGEIPDTLPGINISSCLGRISGNRKLFVNLMSKFCNDNTDTAEKIKTALESGHVDEAREMTHTIKGVAGNLSAGELHESSLELENAIKNGNEDTDRLLFNFEKALIEVISSASTIASMKDTLLTESTEKQVSRQTDKQSFSIEHLNLTRTPDAGH